MSKYTKVRQQYDGLTKELTRLSDMLTQKYGQKITVSPTTDGLCVMLEEKDTTGVTLDEFEEMEGRKDFDINKVNTYL